MVFLPLNCVGEVFLSLSYSNLKVAADARAVRPLPLVSGVRGDTLSETITITAAIYYALRSVFGGSILLILSNTQYFRRVDTAYIEQYAVFSGGRYCLY